MVLGANEAVADEKLLPVRMLNELAYCPRLYFLEWVQGEFVDNVHTIEGRAVHARVDSGKGELPGPESAADFAVRSVMLSSSVLGLSARIDLVEGENGVVQPVDYKRGRLPVVAEGAWEPERIQLCAYGLLLREHGYRCDSGILYFAQAKRRVEIAFDDELIARTMELLDQAREIAARGEIPAPLRASPKCEGCSLHAICLPDEIDLLQSEGEEKLVRQVLVPRGESSPLYVTEQGTKVGLDGSVLVVRDRDRKVRGTSRLMELSQVVMYGNVQISAQALHELFDRGIPVCWLTFGGWLRGLSEGLGHNNVLLRRTQMRHADDGVMCLKLARRFVRNKIANCRTLLRRNHSDAPESALRELQRRMADCDEASEISQLLGIEGNAARVYFENFSGMLKPVEEESFDFDFTVRSRRPPKDPVNALLSMAYSLLAKDVTLTARAVGLDPFVGFFHQSRYGRPALALDVMEEFRPLIADSVVLSAINTGVIRSSDFIRSGIGVALTSDARRRFIAAYERRLEEEVTHPVFGYRASYRRTLEVQCRLLSRFLIGEIDEYPEFRTR